MFTGKRLVLIAQGDGLAPFHQVCDKFPESSDCLAVENSRELGEFRAFSALLSGVRDTDPWQTTFYAHTKGVSPKYQQPGRLRTVRLWAEAMYTYNLDSIAEVDRALASKSVVGTFRRVGQFRSLHRLSRWHYSGAFFWFRNRDLFSRDWQSALIPSRYCPEFYPSLLFGLEASACLGPDVVGDLYSYEYLSALLKGRKDYDWNSVDRVRAAAAGR